MQITHCCAVKFRNMQITIVAVKLHNMQITHCCAVKFRNMQCKLLIVAL